MSLETWDCLDGRQLRMRRGRFDDIDRFLEFELHLSPGTRYFRFGKVRDPGYSRDQVVGLFDPADDCNVHYVVTTTENSCEVMIASGRLVVPPATSACELLIVVRDDWHGRGLGQRLVTKLFREAARRRVHIVYCQVMPTNRRMQIFMRRCGFTQTINPDHEVLLRFEKPVAAHEALA